MFFVSIIKLNSLFLINNVRHYVEKINGFCACGRKNLAKLHIFCELRKLSLIILNNFSSRISRIVLKTCCCATIKVGSINYVETIFDFM